MKKFSLSSEERISNKKDFDCIYQFGRTVYSHDKKLKAVFLINKKSGKEGIKIAAAVSKKAGNAVWRNRVKRLIKESYRLKKYYLLHDILELKISLLIVFAPYILDSKKNKKISFNDIVSPVEELLKKIKIEIFSKHQSDL